MATEGSCDICLDDFTKQPSKRRATCPYCDIKACVKCTQTYLLGTHEDPHCMGCRKGWSRTVMDTLLLVGWIQNEYKKHRENILMDREKSRLPAAQLVIGYYKEAEERQKKVKEMHKEAEEVLRLYRQIEARIAAEHRNIYTLRSGRPVAQPAEGQQAQEVERRAFVMPCPASGCRGFLSTAYKCGVCDVYCCPECHELKGAMKDTPHECNPNTVATVKMMKKECKPCPSCGTNIFRIAGCSQMWCTQCQTPFDWTSGKKVTSGVIHNPHYYDYVRKMNGGVMPRTAGDIPCGAYLPGAWEFERLILREYFGHGYGYANSNKFASSLYKILNCITHIQHVEIPRFTNRQEDMDNTELNVQYLQKVITEARWKQLIQQKEKKRMKKDEIQQVLAALVGAAVDIYGNIMTHARNKAKKDVMAAVVEESMKQFRVLQTIVNEGMMEISKRYKCQVLQLMGDTFTRENKKYSTGRTVQKKKKDDKKGDKKETKTQDAVVEESDSESDWESEEDVPKNEIVKA